MNGSTAPGGASCAHASRARSRTRTFGELSFWAIRSGTTKPSTGCPGPEDESGPVRGLSPLGTVPISDAEPVPFPKARGVGLANSVTGVDELLRGDGLCLERDGPSSLARGGRLGALSEEGGPQLASQARSIKLRRSARYDRDGRISSDRSGGAQRIRGVVTGGIAVRFNMFCWV